jgi:hypothetical protein
MFLHGIYCINEIGTKIPPPHHPAPAQKAIILVSDDRSQEGEAKKTAIS